MSLTIRDSMADPGADVQQDYTKNLSGFCIVLIVLAAICMVMRVSARKLRNHNLERDDWTFLAGTTLAQGLFITSLVYSFDAGLGKHWASLTAQQKTLFPKLNYAYNLLNLSCYPIIKLSILLLYLRIFPVHCFRQFCWAGVGFVSAMCVANTLVAIFACTPVRSFWDASTPGTCIQDVPFYWATAILNVITDVYILTLPMPVVWQSRMATKRKIAISMIFMLGGLTFVVSIIRIVYYLDFRPEDPSYSFLGVAFATPAEVCLAIIVASAPTWRPVWTYTYHTVSTHWHRVRSRGLTLANFVAAHRHAREVTLTEHPDSQEEDSSTSSRTQTHASRKSSVTFVEDANEKSRTKTNASSALASGDSWGSTVHV